jgi:hypothetical protein
MCVTRWRKELQETQEIILTRRRNLRLLSETSTTERTRHGSNKEKYRIAVSYSVKQTKLDRTPRITEQ